MGDDFICLWEKKTLRSRFETECIDVAGKPLEMCSDLDKYQVLVSLIKSQASKVRTETLERVRESKEKEVYYFSMEFLIGRLLNNYLLNLGIQDVVRSGLAELGEDLDRICALERDPDLATGGLGRLAACFMDSMASGRAWRRHGGSATDLACSSKRL